MSNKSGIRNGSLDDALSMSTHGIPKKSARLFRITHVVFAVLFSGVATWLFATSRSSGIAWIFAVAAAFALIDAIVGWQKSSN